MGQWSVHAMSNFEEGQAGNVDTWVRDTYVAGEHHDR